MVELTTNKISALCIADIVFDGVQKRSVFCIIIYLSIYCKYMTTAWDVGLGIPVSRTSLKKNHVVIVENTPNHSWVAVKTKHTVKQPVRFQGLM